MKKSDLRSGMKVEIADGSEFIVMFNHEYGDVLLPIDSSRGSVPLGIYDEGLQTKNKKYIYLDIISISNLEKSLSLFNIDSDSIWKNIYTKKKKKITIDEIEKELGYEIEIVE